VLIWAQCCIAADHFVSPSGGNVAPFISWDTAATNIQDAIDAASASETVWVTNGVYATGGKVMAGDLTNRVALDKALTVQSVNGPLFTIIQGAWDPATTNGPLAVRCAWLTNGAVLSGFTLEGGGTRALAAPYDSQQRGGGVYGTTNRAVLDHCVIRCNSASNLGGGAYQVSLSACVLTGNSVSGTPAQSTGGGAYLCNMTNCTVSGNFSIGSGGGAMGGFLRNCALIKNVALGGYGGGYAGIGMNGGTLVNCTVSWNTSGGYSGYPSPGGGVAAANVINSVVYANKTLDTISPGTSNYYLGTFSYSCAIPLPTGTGNIAIDPQLISDGIHLASGSPCIGAGLIGATGTDIDGQTFGNPPSIGCDEWFPAAIAAGTPLASSSGIPPVLNVSGVGAGQPPLSYSWLKDGSPVVEGGKYQGTYTPNLTVTGFGPADAGAYQLVVSNSFGVSTSAVDLVVVHCANSASSNPVPPYVDWSLGATDIQDAVDAANLGDFVLVTNGVYATGGRIMAGDLLNRVAINKPLVISSMNGPAVTTVLGAYDPVTTNGPLAVRCAWLGQGAVLRGMTLQHGATRNAGDWMNLQSGGGVFCSSTNEVLFACILSNNAAAWNGGGSYQGKVSGSVLCGNTATYGGGASYSWLFNSLVRSNSASNGGGLFDCRLVNCTVIGNVAPSSLGGGVYGSIGWNSIIFYNIAPGYQSYYNDWDLASRFSLISCWTTSSQIPGQNSTPGPQFVLDNVHLAATSPCRGTGNPLYVSGTDLDGEPWLNPPSIGCAEYYAGDYTGALFPGPITAYNIWSRSNVLRNVTSWVYTSLTGNADRVAWSFGDGATITNNFTLGVNHTWTNTGDFNVTFTAYNADNPAGISTNALIHVALPDAPLLSTANVNATNFVLSFPVQAGVTYVVQQATNLAPPIPWQTVSSFRAFFSTTVWVTNNISANTSAFFRVSVQ
jgi:hypothetical protein